MSTILSTQGLPEIVPVKPESAAGPNRSGFSQILAHANEVLAHADSAAAQFAHGNTGLTEAVLASEKADTTFQVLMAVRNRALAAYQEIMNLQV
ncbi:MAG: flagellar hook-basal body complex protein FliE [Deltaproteobacteria bacterium]|nr:flagellar hook-basal body complex protein FliE [Deltaproteobacteria bacterium]